MSNRVKSIKLELTREECYCGLPDFYNRIAKLLNHDPSKVRQYNCTKICVSKPVQDEIFSFYRNEQDASDQAIGATWVRFGPKANMPHKTFMVDIQEGFIEEVES